MKLLIPAHIKSELAEALAKAGKREIGGILMGVDLGNDTFRITEITIQRIGGTFAAFQRLVSEILAPLHAFFKATRHQYTTYNYMGEWHSHHSFRLLPSDQDHATMLSMISDHELGANFILLLLVRLNFQNELETSVTVYLPQKAPYTGQVCLEA